MRVEHLGDDVTLYLGDCLEVLPTLAAGSVDAVVTDPPYDVTDEVLAQLGAAFDLLKLKGMAYVILDYTGVHKAAMYLSSRLPIENEIIWKVGWVSGFRSHVNGKWVVNHNTILQFGKSEHFHTCLREPKTARRARYNTPTKPIAMDTVWDDLPAPRQTSFVVHKTGHPHEKPLRLMKRLIDSLGDTCPVVLDPFMGSGTTGVACVQTGRRFIGIEIEPRYFEIAKRRITDAQAQMRMPLAEAAK